MDTSVSRNFSNRVRQGALPPDARALSTLSRVDYSDAFFVRTGSVQERTAEQWARVILEDAPMAVRKSLLSGWLTIGLKLDRSRSGHSVLGWEVRGSAADFVLLSADSRVGMPAQLLVARRPGELLFATFVQLGNLIARTMWAAIEPAHVRIVHDILEQASQRDDPDQSR
jgi:hypothetical protein